MLSGEVASVLGDLARQRWLAATGETLDPPSPGDHAPWPDGVAPELEDVEVAVARTLPEYKEAATAAPVRTLPLPPRLTEDEAARHRAFVATMGEEALWWRFIERPPAAETTDA